MRGLRSTIALLIVLMAGSPRTSTSSRGRSRPRPAQTEKVFACVRADKIDELKITSDKGDVDTAEEGQRQPGRSSRRWPRTADESERRPSPTRSASSRSSASSTRTRPDLKDYGLATPPLTPTPAAPDTPIFARLTVGPAASSRRIGRPASDVRPAAPDRPDGSSAAPAAVPATTPAAVTRTAAIAPAEPPAATVTAAEPTIATAAVDGGTDPPVPGRSRRLQARDEDAEQGRHHDHAKRHEEAGHGVPPELLVGMWCEPGS